MPVTPPPSVEQSYPYPESPPIARSNALVSVRSNQRLLDFSLQGIDLAGSRRIRLVFRGVQKTTASRVLRISLMSSPSVRLIAGNLYTYGEGAAAGSPRKERFFPLTLSLDITDALRPLAGSERVEAYLDILDPHGRVLIDEMLYLESVEVEVAAP